jgi:phosphoglycolate phosphatase-like HAD superfamily hydrolase
MTFKRLAVFDLDETLIDSSHRTPNKPDGTLDLDKYFAMKNRKSIFEDSLLPLADTFKRLDRKENYVVICTARAMNQDDWDFLAAHGLDAHLVLCRPLDGSENHIKDAALKARKIQRLRNLKQFRGKPVVMFDDAIPVIRAMRQIGVACLNAVKVNQRLQNR